MGDNGRTVRKMDIEVLSADARLSGDESRAGRKSRGINAGSV